MNSSWRWIKYHDIIPTLIKIKKALDPFTNWSSKEHLPYAPEAFFIMGSGRNGSTVLAKYLNKHSHIFLPPETYSIPFSIMRYNLKFWNSWEKFVKEFLSEVKNNSDSWALDESDYNHLENQLSQISPNYRNFSNAYRLLYLHYSSKFKQGISYIGDHSPINTRFFATTIPELTDSKFIFLIRDPLDTIYSTTKIHDHRLSKIKQAAWNWNQSIKCYEFLKKKNYPLILIKYENLVRNPKKTMNRIIDFLDIPWVNLLEKDHRSNIIKVERHTHHKNVSKPLSSKYIGKGRKNLSDKSLAQLIPLIQENANKFNYF